MKKKKCLFKARIILGKIRMPINMRKRIKMKKYAFDSGFRFPKNRSNDQ